MQAIVIFIIFFCIAMPQAIAQNTLPQFITTKIQRNTADLTGLSRLRFLTTTDFAPFNYINSQGQLNGYNIDLARAICSELKLENICQIEALPWNELQASLKKGDGEAIIAGLAPSAENRILYSFSRPYLKLPARFISLKTMKPDSNITKEILQKPVGVLEKSKHSDIFSAYFPDLTKQNFDSRAAMLNALKAQEISAIFDDGLSLSHMLEDDDANRCCHFIGKPYFAPQLANNQMSIAVSQNNTRLNHAFDYALSELERKGVLNEIYMRHFPVSFF